jgi:hypothetical protein
MIGIQLLAFRDGVDDELLHLEVDNPHRDRSRSAVLDRAAAHCAQHGGTTLVSIYEGSTLGSQVRDFARLHNGDLEIVRTVYTRRYSAFQRDVVEEGSLTMDPLANNLPDQYS